MVQITKCACGCGAETKRDGRRGPAPLYATPACRVRALRRRRELTELEPIPDQAPPVPVHIATARTDDQVAQSLLDARAIGYALQRLGTQARPDLAWRCTKLGDAIVAAIKDTFPEVER